MSNKPASPDDLLHPTKISPMQWLILFLCMVASMIEGFDIVIISYTAPAISEDLAVSPSELGIVFSAGLFGMAFGAMLLGGLSDKFGRKTVVSTALLIAGLGTLAVAYSASVTQLVVWRVTAGLALGALIATLPALVGEFSPLKYRTLVIAVLLAAANFGGFAGGLIVAEIIVDAGWRAIFMYTGGLTIATAVVVQFLVPESIAFVIQRGRERVLAKVNRTLAYVGQSAVAELPQVAEARKREPATVKSLLTHGRGRTTLLLWSAFFLAFLTVYFISSWMPKVLTGAGLSQQAAIQGTTALPAGAIFGNILIGWLATWWPLKRILIGAFIIGGICMATLSGVHQSLASMPFYLIWLMLLVTGSAMFGAFGNLYNVAMIVYPVQVRGTGLGWAAGLGRTGAVLSPSLAGVMMAAGFSMPSLFFYFALPAFAAGLCVAFIGMREMD
ncbi:MAG: MFS transporter [Halieaceae bacterium]|nr:MFS transporter [Halieaceae bacterium]